MYPAAAFRLLLLALVTVALAGKVEAQTTHIVTVGDNFFSPSNLTIQVGDSVEFRNAAGGNSHNVTWQSGGFTNQPTASSFTYTVTFNNAGTFNYECTIHFGMDGSITVQGGGGQADLAVQGVDATNGTYEPGDTIAIDIDISNVGSAGSTNYTVTYYASTNSTINSSDIELGSSNRTALGAGAETNFSDNGVFPGSIADGNYFIGVVIELNDANNANNSGFDNTQVTVQAPQAAAELALTEVSVASGNYQQGASIAINAEVQNSGDGASGGYSVDFYASTNLDINTQDRLLSTQNRASLPAGNDDSFSFNATIPGNLAPGNYFIGGIVDFSDGNAGNNEAVDNEAITVQGTGGGDFEINAGLNDAWFNPDTAGQGFFVTVFPDIESIFLAWFTYDTQRPPQNVTALLGEPGHRWITAFGDYSGDTATLDVELTQGGIFDSPQQVQQTPGYGTITLTFTDCENGEVAYNIPSVGVSGTVPIERIALDNVPFCESEAAAAAAARQR